MVLGCWVGSCWVGVCWVVVGWAEGGRRVWAEDESAAGGGRPSERGASRCPAFDASGPWSVDGDLCQAQRAEVDAAAGTSPVHAGSPAPSACETPLRDALAGRGRPLALRTAPARFGAPHGPLTPPCSSTATPRGPVSGPTALRTPSAATFTPTSGRSGTAASCQPTVRSSAPEQAGGTSLASSDATGRQPRREHQRLRGARRARAGQKVVDRRNSRCLFHDVAGNKRKRTEV